MNTTTNDGMRGRTTVTPRVVLQAFARNIDEHGFCRFDRLNADPSLSAVGYGRVERLRDRLEGLGLVAIVRRDGQVGFVMTDAGRAALAATGAK
jgi:hypothetical protein